MSKREYPDRPICGVGAVVIKDGKVLLVKRGVEPNKDAWAIPGGSLKLGETLQEGAEREILEETCVTIKAGAPVYSFDFFERDSHGKVRFHYVVVDVIAEYVCGEAKGADDALEARWVSLAELKHMKVSRNTLKILDFLRSRFVEEV
ncbi:MAG TPA: NUDIX hydrolase [Syntrophales bacterium]|nr:NUDIX hydrolase [Syntrophales bacterium]